MTNRKSNYLEQMDDAVKRVIIEGLNPMFQAMHEEMQEKRKLTILVTPNIGSYKMRPLNGQILKGGFKTCERFDPKTFWNRVVEISGQFNIEGHRPEKLDGPYRFDVRFR